MFQLNYRHKVLLMFNKVGSYCENLTSTKEQEVDALVVNLSG